jgi:hypothetical protein
LRAYRCQLAPVTLGAYDGPVREWALLATAPLLFALCAQRDLSALERWSATSVLLCVLLAAFVAFEFVATDGALAGAQHGTPLPLVRPGVVQAFGTIAFAFVNNDTGARGRGRRPRARRGRRRQAHAGRRRQAGGHTQRRAHTQTDRQAGRQTP